MARKFLTAIDLVQNELQNARVQNLAGPPSTPVKGQIYYDSTANVLYWWDGTTWQSASGGMSFGSIAAETVFGAAGTNGVAATAARSDHKHGNPTHVNADHSAITLNSLAAPTGAVSMGSQSLTNLAAPSAGTDAANKNYVDGVAQGLDTKASVRIASVTNHSLTGLTAIDGVTPIAGDRILVKNQTNVQDNGIYVAAAGAWARATDLDNWAEVPGAYVFVEEGSTQADTGWVTTANAGGTLGTTPMPWTQFAGVGTVIAGNGLTLTGNTLDIVAQDASIVVSANAIQVGLAGSGSLNTVARSDHTHAASRYQVNVGGATSVVVNHALGTKDVIVQVYRIASPFDQIECDVEHTDTANVTVRFATAPSANEYRCVVIA